MKAQAPGGQMTLAPEGPIGETTPMFTVRLDGVTQLTLDLDKVTYINSVGVREWIIWNNKLPIGCQVRMINCPFVFASQASMVMGFLAKNMKIESVRLPFVCEDCNYEESILAQRGQEFEYASPGVEKKITLPEGRTCPKCKKGTLEPDFILEKALKFLG